MYCAIFNFQIKMERRKSNTDPKIKTYRAKLMNLNRLQNKYNEMKSHYHQRWFSHKEYEMTGHKIELAKKEIEKMKSEIYPMNNAGGNEEEEEQEEAEYANDAPDPSDFYAVAEEREEMEGPSEGTQRADGGIVLAPPHLTDYNSEKPLRVFGLLNGYGNNINVEVDRLKLVFREFNEIYCEERMTIYFATFNMDERENNAKNDEYILEHLKRTNFVIIISNKSKQTAVNISQHMARKFDGEILKKSYLLTLYTDYQRMELFKGICDGLKYVYQRQTGEVRGTSGGSYMNARKVERVCSLPVPVADGGRDVASGNTPSAGHRGSSVASGGTPRSREGSVQTAVPVLSPGKNEPKTTYSYVIVDEAIVFNPRIHKDERGKIVYYGITEDPVDRFRRHKTGLTRLNNYIESNRNCQLKMIIVGTYPNKNGAAIDEFCVEMMRIRTSAVDCDAGVTTNMQLSNWAYEQAKKDGERRQNIKKRLIDCIKNEKFAKEYLECAVCQHKSYNAWSHSSHMETHEEPKFKCGLCNHPPYKRKENLKKHINNEHGLEGAELEAELKESLKLGAR